MMKDGRALGNPGTVEKMEVYGWENHWT